MNISLEDEKSPVDNAEAGLIPKGDLDMDNSQSRDLSRCFDKAGGLQLPSNMTGVGIWHLDVALDVLTDSHRFPIDWLPQDRAYACLEVGDTGCGMEGKEIEQIFDPFFSSKLPGRGLGLPVVLGIVRMHNGVVTVESGHGRGSVFRVFIQLSA